MAEETVNNGAGVRVKFYRTPLEPETLARLNAKSDAKGFRQTLQHLGLMAVLGGTAIYSAGRWPWWITIGLFFLYGTVTSFGMSAVHELGHKSVFKTQWLNQLFLRVFAFIGWNNFEHFYASHTRHHQFTLHQPDDLEVVLPIKVMTKQFLKTGFINPMVIPYVAKNTVRLAKGKFEGEWETRLFPADQPEKARPIIMWSRTLLAGHAAILLISIYNGWWLLPVVTSLAPLYGGWLPFLCGVPQHLGLQDKVPDFRLCCRTYTVNPLFQFLYWHMNYHIEHHMYAAVPCYNLAEMHQAILHDLPPCPDGLIATWKEIVAIQRKQAVDPTYQYVAPLPQTSYVA